MSVPVPYACLLKPQRDSRLVVGSLATHAPIEPTERWHVRAMFWFNVTPMALQCWARTTHGDSGILRERSAE